MRPKRHTKELEQSERSNDRGLGNVLWTNRYLMETFDQVDLAEDMLAGEVGSKIVDAWNRITIVLRDAVESAVIAAWPPAAPRFGSYV